MQRAKWVACVALSVLAVACSGSNSSAPAAKAEPAKADAPAMANMDMKAAPPGTDDAKIQSAMSAAPANIAKDAAIMDVNADGSMKQLRAGTNGYTCLPDNPGTPGPDPMCIDKAGMPWMDAMMKHKDPPKGVVSLAYMLAGGSDASNTDPFATQPAAGGKWVTTGPHVMIIGAVPMMQGYSGGTDPDTSKPYIMFAGTPYEHLMVPVK